MGSMEVGTVVVVGLGATLGTDLGMGAQIGTQAAVAVVELVLC